MKMTIDPKQEKLMDTAYTACVETLGDYEHSSDLAFHMFSWLVCYLADVGMTADELCDHLRMFVADHETLTASSSEIH